jgi:hypothetical protein
MYDEVLSLVDPNGPHPGVSHRRGTGSSIVERGESVPLAVLVILACLVAGISYIAAIGSPKHVAAEPYYRITFSSGS